MNVGDKVHDSAKFLLPMDRPEGPAGISRAVLDKDMQMYRVTTRGHKEKELFPVQLTSTVPRPDTPVPKSPIEGHLGLPLKPENFNWADKIEEAEALDNLVFPGVQTQISSYSEDADQRQIVLQDLEEEVIASNGEQPDEDKATVVPSYGRAMKALDLDAVFGGEATDLEEDSEEVAAASDGGDSTLDIEEGLEDGDSSSALPELRQYIPESVVDETRVVFDSLPLRDRDQPKEDAAWAFSVRCAEWQHMCKASRVLRSQKAHKRKPLQAGADRGLKEFLGFLAGKDNLSHPPVSSKKDEVPFHHINFLGNRVSTKSATLPELSLWLAITSSRKLPFNPLTRQGVIAAQATKLIDPIQYTGPTDVLQLSGTKLLNAVTGFVEKVYHPIGSWRFDTGGEDEIPPRALDYDNWMWDNSALEFEQMQKPHFVDPEADGDVVLNDDNKAGPMLVRSVYKAPRPQSARSKLCIVERAGQDTEELSSHLPSVSYQARYIYLPLPSTPKVNLGIAEPRAEEDLETRTIDSSTSTSTSAPNSPPTSTPLTHLSPTLLPTAESSTPDPNFLEIPYADISEIPGKPRTSHSVIYSPFAVAVGKKAYEIGDWVSSCFW